MGGGGGGGQQRLRCESEVEGGARLGGAVGDEAAELRRELLLLKLEEAEPGKFLETSYVKEGSHISYRLKNVNEESIKVWRYHHYRSRLAYATKRATMMAALRKAFDMGSDSEQKLIGIQAKCKEFINLEYPPGILKFMCVRLYHETGHTVWLIAKGTI